MSLQKKTTFYTNNDNLPTVMEVSLEHMDNSVVKSSVPSYLEHSHVKRADEEMRIDQNHLEVKSRWTQGRIYGFRAL